MVLNIGDKTEQHAIDDETSARNGTRLFAVGRAMGRKDLGD